MFQTATLTVHLNIRKVKAFGRRLVPFEVATKGSCFEFEDEVLLVTSVRQWPRIVRDTKTLTHAPGKGSYVLNAKRQMIPFHFTEARTNIRRCISDQLEQFINVQDEVVESAEPKMIFQRTAESAKGIVKPRLTITIHFIYTRKILTCKPANPTKPCSAILLATANDYIVYNGQTYRVLKFSEASLGSIKHEAIVLKPFEKACKATTTLDEIVICFDVETCGFTPWGQTSSRHQPYLMHCIVDLGYDRPGVKVQEHFTFHEKNINQESSSIGAQFIVWLDDYLTNFNFSENEYEDLPVIRMIGFNNHNFDNYFLLDNLRRTPKTRMTLNSRNGKVSEVSILYRGVAPIIVSDLMKWIPDMSLATACVDYEVTDGKMPVDIVAYNRMIEREGRVVERVPDMILYSHLKGFSDVRKLKVKYYNAATKDWAVYDFIVDYCVLDVTATLELFFKIKNTVSEIIESVSGEITLPYSNFMYYRSPAQLSGKIFQALAQKEGTFRLGINHAELGEFIYESYYGGRVDYSVHGEYIAQSPYLRYMDVTSEYALAQTCRYPVLYSVDDVLIGEEIPLYYYQSVIDQVQRGRAARKESQTLTDFTMFKPFDVDFKAIFKCNIYAPENKADLITFAPVASRDPSLQRLQYLNKTQYGRVLNTAQFKNLILCGFTIELLPHKYNIVFLKTMYLFRSFIKIIGEAKTLARGVNKTKAKLLKQFLTACAGKLAQKSKDRIAEYRSNAYEGGGFSTNSSVYAREDWTGSNHYIATFILAEANFILFSTLYRLSLTSIYANIPQSMRCGALLYMDTDSIVYDPALVDESRYAFNCSEEIGLFDEITCDFNSTWKEKYRQSTNCFVCIAKKSYILLHRNVDKYTIVERKLKGIHKEQMKSVSNHGDIKNILHGIPLKLAFNGLIKTPENALVNQRGNETHDVIKAISEGIIRKTLELDKTFNSIECTHPGVLAANAHNLDKTIYRAQVCNYLTFCCSPF
jgi:hypothetical protein